VVAQRILIRREAARLETPAPADAAGAAGTVPVIEKVHVELLTAFAAQMRAEGRALWVISVDHQLTDFPHIDAAVHDLETRGDLKYVEVVDWLHGHEPYHSPEGHMWGAPAHQIIGEHLALDVAAALTDSSTVN
jgi:hypothetical protein